MPECINSDKHLPQSPFTGQFFSMTTFCFGFCIANQSMVLLKHMLLNKENLQAVIMQERFLNCSQTKNKNNCCVIKDCIAKLIIVHIRTRPCHSVKLELPRAQFTSVLNFQKDENEIICIKNFQKCLQCPKYLFGSKIQRPHLKYVANLLFGQFGCKNWKFEGILL